jgi:hypothetical protein
MKRHGSLNLIYRLVWSHVLNAWVAVAETTRGRGKGGRRKLTAAALNGLVNGESLTISGTTNVLAGQTQAIDGGGLGAANCVVVQAGSNVGAPTIKPGIENAMATLEANCGASAAPGKCQGALQTAWFSGLKIVGAGVNL